MATARASRSAPPTRTLLVKDGSGMFKVTIPEDWKVTFGRLYGSSGPRDYGSSEMGLRIYETEAKQRAVFTGVQWFRDLSIPVDRLVVAESGTSSWTRDENGSTESRSVKRTRKSVPETF